jgi:hypothetical protein
MFVLRSTMERAVQAERDRLNELVRDFGHSLTQVNALQSQLAAWVRNEPGDIKPEQMADMFYAQDDRWQAAFFNVLQDRIQAYHDSLPKPRPGQIASCPGVPAGEAQWWHMAQHLDRSGFETIEAMFDHATHAREHAFEANGQFGVGA